MRKFINWYSLAVIIVLIPGSIFLFNIRNENSDTAAYLIPILPILYALCLGLWFILTIIRITLTLIRIVTHPSKPITNKYVIRSIVLLLLVSSLIMISFLFRDSLGTDLIFMILSAFLFIVFIILTAINIISLPKDSNKPHDVAASQSNAENGNTAGNFRE